MRRYPGGRGGFTLIELLTVMIVLGLLASIALLKYLDLRNTARAAEVAGDFRSVMVGAYNYYAEFETWPPDAGAGTVPPALVSFLPSSVSFTKPYYTLDYDNVGLGGGAYMIGITVSSTDADLMAKLIRNLGNKTPYFAAGGTLTYIIVGADGKS
jgi:prepilin-type N-terminal cleavage/methylation domain-containing protein